VGEYWLGPVFWIAVFAVVVVIGIAVR